MTIDLALRRAMDVVPHMTDPTPPWKDILQTSSDLIGSDGAVFLVFEGCDLVSMQQHGVDPATERDYALHFHKQDILLKPEVRRPPGTWLDTQSLLTPAERGKNAYYVDFMCKHRMRHLMSFVIEDTTARTATIGFQREFASDKVRDRLAGAAITGYTQRLQQAVVRRRLAASQWLAAADSAFAAFDEAICLLTPRGAVLHLSARAEEMLASGSGLRKRDGRLWHSAQKVRSALIEALASVSFRGGPAVQLSVPGAQADAAGCRLELVRADLRLRLGREPLVLARIRAPAAHPGHSTETLCVLFGITPAEARVLSALMAGQSPADHASAHGTSVHTVRKQVATLMDKMGCTRQVDLVRMALAAR